MIEMLQLKVDLVSVPLQRVCDDTNGHTCNTRQGVVPVSTYTVTNVQLHAHAHTYTHTHTYTHYMRTHTGRGPRNVQVPTGHT